MYKIVFTLVTLPKGAVRVFLHIYTYCYFFMLLFFLRTIQLLHINVFTDAVGITMRVTSLKKSFCSISPSTGSHFEVFCGSFWVCSCISQELVYLIKFCTVVFSINPTVNGLRNILQHLSFCCGAFRHVVRNIRHIVASLLWTFLGVFGPFCNMFLKY